MNHRIRRGGDSARKGWVLIFVLCSLFCIVFFAARDKFRVPISSQVISAVLAPFQSAVSWTGDQFVYVMGTIRDIATVHEQNRRLRTEVEQLRTMNLEASEYAAENERLRALLDYKRSATKFDLVTARVIGRDSFTWSSTVIIDVGKKNGVQKDMPVVTEKGLVGRVQEAGISSSKVQLILDPRSSVGTLVQRPESRIAGIVEGSTEHPTMPNMVNIPKNADVAEGDVIITSGFGGVYPKGLIVGNVAEMKNDEGGLLKIAVLEPSVDFQRLEDVTIIVASREDAPESLQTPEKKPAYTGARP